MSITIHPKDDTILKLAEFLPYRLSVLSNTVSRQLAEIYETEYGLSVWQWRVMAVLGETPGVSAKDVTTKTAMDKVAVSRAVTGLIDQRYLVKHLSEDDARCSTLHLTKAGQAAYEVIAPHVKAREAELVSGLSRTEYAALIKALETLAQAASPDAPLW